MTFEFNLWEEALEINLCRDDLFSLMKSFLCSEKQANLIIHFSHHMIGWRERKRKVGGRGCKGLDRVNIGCNVQWITTVQIFSGSLLTQLTWNIT